MTEQLSLHFTRFKPKYTNVIYFSQVNIQMFSSNLHKATINRVELMNTHTHTHSRGNWEIFLTTLSFIWLLGNIYWLKKIVEMQTNVQSSLIIGSFENRIKCFAFRFLWKICCMWRWSLNSLLTKEVSHCLESVTCLNRWNDIHGRQFVSHSFSVENSKF